MNVSVVLVTKNGGELLKESLQAICSQRLAEPFEILAIDSGSRDGSAALLASHPRVRFIAIRAGEFQHGRTRNLAMRQAQGGLVVFLTQDAVPASEDWLAQWVDFMAAHSEVAGAFGRQVARADADAIEAWEIARHFESLSKGPPVTHAAATDGSSDRTRRRFFSNVNSCIRKSAWKRIPFPEIDFGEDQAWSVGVQQAGLATAYAEHVLVRHSHAYGPIDLFGRRYDEARFARRQFGESMVSSWGEAVRIARAHAESNQRHLDGLLPNPPAGARRAATMRAWASSLGQLAGTRLALREGFIHRWLSLTERRRSA